jgi:hypothetical protein
MSDCSGALNYKFGRYLSVGAVRTCVGVIFGALAAMTVEACSQELVAIGPASATGGAGNCVSIDESCGTGPSNSCCGGAWCANGTCVADSLFDAGWCVSPGGNCSSQQLCCSEYNNVTQCPTSGGAHSTCPYSSQSMCREHGSPCSDPMQCCSRECASNGYGQRTCMALDGCQPLGETCADGNNCCSHICTNNTCAASSACMREGEICKGSWDCSCQANLECTPTMSGVTRCTNSNSIPHSLPIGSSCVLSEQCSSGQCRQPKRGGAFACQDRCVDDGAPCGTNFDCCTGYCSFEKGVCDKFINGCAPAGSSCQSASCCGNQDLVCDYSETNRCLSP